MINNNLFVGNSVTGNFRPEDEPQKEIHGYQIEKNERHPLSGER